MNCILGVTYGTILTLGERDLLAEIEYKIILVMFSLVWFTY